TSENGAGPSSGGACCAEDLATLASWRASGCRPAPSPAVSHAVMSRNLHLRSCAVNESDRLALGLTPGAEVERAGAGVAAGVGAGDPEPVAVEAGRVRPAGATGVV